MIRVSTIIRIRPGMYCRRTETVRFDSPVTKTSPAHMTTVFLSTLVTARVEQIPRIWTNTGLLTPMPEAKACRYLYELFMVRS